MPTKQYKPTSAARRTRQTLTYEELTVNTPLKSLTTGSKNNAGRNNVGRITVRRRGGGNKRKYRIVDFRRDKIGIPGVISTLEYDPNRTAFIALVVYKDGEKRYILAPIGIEVGDTVQSGPESEIKLGNHVPLANIPVGSTIHNIELMLGKGGQLARSAGVYAVLQSKSDKYASIKMPSGEIRLINLKCSATLGAASNSDHRNRVIGKAGATRWQRRRPKVRGSVMNACDHPHGGGEGRAPIGRSGPMTPWGKPTLGYKTRNNKNDKFILRRRNSK